MDRRKSMKRNHPEDAVKTGTCANDSKCVLNVEAILVSISRLPNYSEDDSLIVYDVEMECEYANLKDSDVCYAAEWSANGNRVFVANWKNRRLEVYENKILTKPLVTQTVVDLDASGRRWEGGVREGKPFGYGVLYSEEGHKEYEGFMVDGKKTGYGMEYYSDIDRVKYMGCFYNSNQFGKGILYDRNGVVEYNGLWKNGEPFSPHFDGRTIDNHTDSLVIPANSFSQSKSFLLHSFIHSLKRLVIGDECFGSVRLFELDGLSELESIGIGEVSFTIAKDWRDVVSNTKEADGFCRIRNCPKLKSIQFRYQAFCDYHSFELTNLPSLQSIVSGEDCFFCATLFSLTGVTEWVV